MTPALCAPVREAVSAVAACLEATLVLAWRPQTRAAGRWRFQPTGKDAVPVPVAVTVESTFARTFMQERGA